jgi:hypothetical protein
VRRGQVLRSVQMLALADAFLGEQAMLRGMQSQGEGEDLNRVRWLLSRKAQLTLRPAWDGPSTECPSTRVIVVTGDAHHHG